MEPVNARAFAPGITNWQFAALLPATRHETPAKTSLRARTRTVRQRSFMLGDSAGCKLAVAWTNVVANPSDFSSHDPRKEGSCGVGREKSVRGSRRGPDGFAR